MTQQQTERDDALIAEVARAISRKVDSFGDTERTEQQRAELEWPRYREHAKAAIDLILARENWTPPAKPDRYVVAAREFLAAWGERVLAVDQGEYDGDKRFQAAAAVLRKHFPSVEVPQEVGKLVDVALASKSQYGIHSSEEVLARFIKDFILKGDQ